MNAERGTKKKEKDEKGKPAVYKLVKNKTEIKIWARQEEKQWWSRGPSQGMINEHTLILICMFEPIK